MRWYQPSWVKLKTDGQIELSLDYADQPRFVKAIRKEYYKDSQFHIELAEANLVCSIYTVRAAHSLRIFLGVKDADSGESL